VAELRFHVPAIVCQHCADAIAARLAELPDIDRAEVDPVTRWVSVWGSNPDIDTIRSAVTSAGHPPDL
jgi:copper chaperone CopZ